MPDCIVLPPQGLPSISVRLNLPNEVNEFYQLCGGVIFFENSSFPVRLVRPEEFVPSNPVIIDKEIIAAEIAKGAYGKEISNDWYIIGDLGNANYIVIDLNQQRSGLCYSAFWERYPSRGDTPIIAKSLTELIERVYEDKGEYYYFEREDFIYMGDAYDCLDE